MDYCTKDLPPSAPTAPMDQYPPSYFDSVAKPPAGPAMAYPAQPPWPGAQPPQPQSPVQNTQNVNVVNTIGGPYQPFMLPPQAMNALHGTQLGPMFPVHHAPAPAQAVAAHPKAGLPMTYPGQQPSPNPIVSPVQNNQNVSIVNTIGQRLFGGAPFSNLFK